jgi:hypothetical protein
MAAPLDPTGFEAHSEITADRPATALVAELARMLTDRCARALARAADRSCCAVCADRHPRGHLLAAAGTDDLPACPACAFDGDVLVTGGQTGAYLACQLDQLTATDLAAPAGWAAPTALLARARTGRVRRHRGPPTSAGPWSGR